MRSMLSCCVAPDELGKIYALLSAFDNLLPLGITEAYSLIFEVSDIPLILAPNFCSTNFVFGAPKSIFCKAYDRFGKPYLHFQSIPK